ncbi:neogenin-like, partial [Penaeus indicus]|uniref:neogenin-like n=1 Tax=Penaeus indicus TaxID=29960 RepID=UPI00300D8D31
ISGSTSASGTANAPESSGIWGGLTFTYEPQSAVVSKGSPAWLHCAARVSEGHPAPTLAWQKDGYPVGNEYDGRRTILANGTLYLKWTNGPKSPSPDEGVYQCVASSYGVGRIVSRGANLSVLALQRFEEEPEDVEVFEGERARFPCSLRGTSGGVGGERRGGMGDVFGRGGGEGGIGGGGIWETGSSSSSSSSSLAPPMSSSSSLSSSSSPSSSSSSVSSSSLSVSVSWFKDSQPLEVDSRMTLLPSGALEIENVVSSDEGEYYCHASSFDKTKVSHTATLRVRLFGTLDTSGFMALNTSKFMTLDTSRVYDIGHIKFMALDTSRFMSLGTSRFMTLDTS